MKMKTFQFCPFCGTAYPQEQPEPWTWECQQCKQTLYQNQAVTDSGIVVQQDQLLFVVRGRQPHIGLLDFPGGFVQPNERIEEGLLREIKEELSVRAEIIKYLGLYGPLEYDFEGFLGYNCDHFYQVKLLDQELKPADDVAEIIWKPLNNLPKPEEIAFFSHRWLVEKLQNKEIVLEEK